MVELKLFLSYPWNVYWWHDGFIEANDINLIEVKYSLRCCTFVWRLEEWNQELQKTHKGFKLAHESKLGILVWFERLKGKKEIVI